MRAAALIAALLSVGCSHLYRKHFTVARMPVVASDHEMVCYRLDNAQVGWGATSVVASALAGGATTLTPVFDDKAAQYSLASGSVALTVLAALAVYMREVDVKRFTEQCRPAGGP